MQFQFNDIQRIITKLDKLITIIRSRGSANSKSRVKVGMNNIMYKKGKNSTKKSPVQENKGNENVEDIKIELVLFRELTSYSQFLLTK